MKIEIFIAVRGGVVQGVRAGPAPAEHDDQTHAYGCYVVDYDNYDHDGADAPYPGTEEDFERSILDGRTWAEIEKTSEAVF